MELKLKNVTSYSKDSFTNINLTKKINIFYGHNGCGKSTISNYFYNTTHADYIECQCSLIENYRPLVYNSKFIEDNFYNTTQQKGVFTLSKENADIEKQLLEKEELKTSLTSQYKEKKLEQTKLIAEKEKEDDRYIDLVWTKTDFVRSSNLKILMRGSIGSKKDFFSQVKKTNRVTEINLSTLINEYNNLLKHKNNEIPSLPPFSNYIISVEDQELLSTQIIDKSNSYLSETIKKLQNLDWVKKGKDYYLSGDSCPFCQQNTITNEFLAAIESIFDKSYSDKVNQIHLIKSAYETGTKAHFQKIHQAILACELISDNEKEKSISYLTILEAIADKNLELISEKITNPSTTIKLNHDNEIENKIASTLIEYNKSINDINLKVKKFKESENAIKRQIWGAIRDLCHPEFESLSKYEESYEDSFEKLQSQMKEIAKKGQENNQEIAKLRSQISNIDSTIDSINLRLKSLGIYGFSIKKHSGSEDKYIISRSENTEQENVYRSLSEGEKTLITFLYFLEYCKGRTDKNDNDARDALIVIDDPISSLSQNYVYDIASIIHHELIKNDSTKKIIILTHNLYFFHELIKLAPKSKDDKLFKRDYYLGRITKNNFSLITEIDKNSVQNEYQSLWQILKDARDGKVNKIIIPNIMRNILEYYFAFVHRTDSLQSELLKLANDDNNNDFRAFYRYINRGSHSDAVNITDMGDIAPEKYMEQLRKIFSMTGDQKHYIKMMDEEEEEEGLGGVTA
ncbi:AAA family ATPase [Kosakonia sp. MUSA4]|uniref:AAA family ATPase n=1 Tax=Kosakonia sp. MUSA4 TaxID=2067958 RepID=UPI0015989B33|nr:AAA family ATPase [Kosakonia sp. MUSA4]QJT83430.1 hypothetical protein C0557_26710 [Kosakonia sp. MUSA4]